MVRGTWCFSANFGLVTAPAFVSKIAHESDFSKKLSICVDTNIWANCLRALSIVCAYNIKSFSEKKSSPPPAALAGILILFSLNAVPYEGLYSTRTVSGSSLPCSLGKYVWLYKSATVIFIAVSLGFHNC